MNILKNKYSIISISFLLLFSIISIIPVHAASNDLPQKIENAGMKYIGIPYQYGANPNQTDTFDCSSFTYRIFYENNIILPRTSEQQSELGYEVPLSEAQKGDLVFFKSPGSTEVDHVGYYLGDMKMLNATVSKGVKVTDISTYYWTSRFVKVKHVLPKTYTVVSGDSLWKISLKTNASIAQLREWNELSNDMLYIGQNLIVSNPDLTYNVGTRVKSYLVQPGDSLWLISQKTNVSIQNIQKWNSLDDYTIYVGQKLLLEPPFITYKVVSGDSLWKISNDQSVSINAIKKANSLTSDVLYIGQTLIIPKSM